MDLLRDPPIESYASQRHNDPDVTFIEIVNLSSRKHEYIPEGNDRPKSSSQLMFHIASVKFENCEDDSEKDGDLTDK